MSASTNSLVAKVKQYGAPVVLGAAIVGGATLFLNHNGVHAASFAAAPLDDNSVSSLEALDHAVEQVAARVTPAVVNIAVTSKSTGEMDTDQDSDGDDQPQPQRQQRRGQSQSLPPELQQFFGQGGGLGGGQFNLQQEPQQPQIQHGIGSGIIISPDGYIVTNNHVVEGATQIKVTLNDRRVLTGKLIGTDKLTDIAVGKGRRAEPAEHCLGRQLQAASGPDRACVWQPLRVATVLGNARDHQRGEPAEYVFRQPARAGWFDPDGCGDQSR